eukprot:SAG31_NODE_2987_length_4816_cov_4.118084_2_plen_663_part_00
MLLLPDDNDILIDNQPAELHMSLRLWFELFVGLKDPQELEVTLQVCAKLDVEKPVSLLPRVAVLEPLGFSPTVSECIRAALHVDAARDAQARANMDIREWLRDLNLEDGANAAAAVSYLVVQERIETLGALAAAAKTRVKLESFISSAGGNAELVDAAWDEVVRMHNCLQSTGSAAEKSMHEADEKGKALLVELAMKAKAQEEYEIEASQRALATLQAAAEQAEAEAAAVSAWTAASARLAELCAAATLAWQDDCCQVIQRAFRVFRHRNVAATTLQRVIRMATDKTSFHRKRVAAEVLQTWTRRRNRQRHFSQLQIGVLSMQRLARGVVTRQRLARMHAAARTIQVTMLPKIRQRVYCRAARDHFLRVYASVELQSAVRCWLSRQERVRRKWALLSLQSCRRGVLIRRRVGRFRYAALEISRIARGRLVRAQMRHLIACTTFIQATHRGCLSRTKTRQLIERSKYAKALWAPLPGLPDDWIDGSASALSLLTNRNDQLEAQLYALQKGLAGESLPGALPSTVTAQNCQQVAFDIIADCSFQPATNENSFPNCSLTTLTPEKHIQHRYNQAEAVIRKALSIGPAEAVTGSHVEAAARLPEASLSARVPLHTLCCRPLPCPAPTVNAIALLTLCLPPLGTAAAAKIPQEAACGCCGSIAASKL